MDVDDEVTRSSRANISMSAINEVRNMMRNGQCGMGSTLSFPNEENKVERVIDKEEDKKRIEKLNKFSVSVN